jgi:hypothetical protein
MRTRARIWATALAAAAVALAVPATPAGASPSTASVERKGSTTTVTWHKATTADGVAVNAEGPPVITCQVVSDFPHNSSHAPGRINVVGRVDCSAPIAEIDLIEALFSGNTVANAKQRVAPNFATLSVQADIACVPGTYFGLADAILIAPPGYSPPGIHAVFESPPVSLSC